MCTFVIKPTESQHTDDVVPIFCKVSLLVNWAVLFLILVVRTGKMRHIALPLIIKNNHLYGGSFSIYLFVCMSTNAQIVYDRWPQRILASIDVSTKWLKTTHFNDLLLAVFFSSIEIHCYTNYKVISMKRNSFEIFPSHDSEEVTREFWMET